MLMGEVRPWRTKLFWTFVFGVVRTLAFIGTGVLSALVMLAVKNGEPFGGLLIARKTSGWRGRGAARWVLVALAALLLAYVGSRFVFEVLLHRSVV